MTSILMLAHRFPPSGGAGVQRNIQLARHLPAAGFRPIIVTGPGAVDYRWTPVDDGLSDSRLAAEVHRLPAPEPPHGARWEARLERWLRTPTRWQRWWAGNLLRLAEDVGREAAVVHASIAPYAGAEAAVAVARRLGKPLVVDLEDPWALDEMLVYPTRLHRELETRRMRRILVAADAVVMNTREARRRVLRRFGELAPDRVHAIPNAFDPADFEAPAAVRDDGRFRIVHAGSLHTEFGLRHRSSSRLRRIIGGAVPGVDFLTRSHVFLLEAIERMRRRRPDLAEHVDVVLAGVFTDQDRAVAAPHPFVQLRDFVPHAGTVELMRTADLLFLPMHDLPPGERARVIPHKTYEYVAARRPILAAVPDGDARDLLAESGAALLCRPGDVPAMEAHLESEVERWKSGAPRPEPSSDVQERCSSRRLVEELGAVYDAVAGTGSR